MKKLTAVAAALVLTLAACGGDDGGDADAPESTEATSDTEASGEPADDTEAPAGTEAPADTEAPDDEPISTGNSFCDSAQAIAAAFDDLDTEAVISDPQAFQDAFDVANEELQGLAANPPAEVAEELGLMAGAYVELAAALETVGYSFEDLFTDASASAVLEQMDSAEMNAAGEALDAYTKDECGFTIGDSEGSDTGSTDEGSSDTLPGSDVSIPLGGEDVAATVTAMYQQMFGLDEAKASCLADAVLAMGGDAEAATSDMSAMMSVLADCDISVNDLAGAMQS